MQRALDAEQPEIRPLHGRERLNALDAFELVGATSGICFDDDWRRSIHVDFAIAARTALGNDQVQALGFWFLVSGGTDGRVVEHVEWLSLLLHRIPLHPLA